MLRFTALCLLAAAHAAAHATGAAAELAPLHPCKTDADCAGICSYCMDGAGKTPPFVCHAPQSGCCTADADCAGSYCMNGAGKTPPFHCHGSLVVGAAVNAEEGGKAPTAPPRSSPWCADPTHPAEPGMYGPMGAHADLVNNTDLPDDDTLVALFQQGIAHIYGFNLVEALRNFRAAVELAPNCALCHWGVAYSFAPNINYFIENQTALNAAARRAVALVADQPSLSRKAQRLINATAQLVAPDDNVDGPTSPYRQAWADAMCADLDDDPDIDSFCASALMALSPWNYYQGMAGGSHYPLKPFLQPAKDKLLGAVHRGAGGGPHVFAIHLLIHLLEPSNAPENFRWEALEPARLLFAGGEDGAELVPSQGHLTHMPAHLFLRTGLYNDAVDTSAVSTDRDNSQYVGKCLTAYAHGHNLKMYVANARLAGRLGDALKHATAAAQPFSGPEPTPGGNTLCVDCAGPGCPEVVLTNARFGRWDAVLAEPVPKSWGAPDVAAYHEAGTRYARAVAMWAKSNQGENATIVQDGDAEAALCRAAARRAANPNQLENYTVIFPAQLDAARALHVGGQADGKGGEPDWATAIRRMRDVVAADDFNAYLEPPRVWYPPRECLGALLAAAPASAGGNVSEALQVFKADLENFVASPWSLYGAAAAAAALGDAAAAKNYTAQADKAWAKADTTFTTPCPELLA